MLLEIKKLFQRYPVTAIFIFTSVLISSITWFGSLPSTYWFIYYKPYIMSGEIWRLLTPMFLHFPIMGVFFAHLAFNMIWFYQFASNIEKIEGKKFLIILIIISAIISNYTQSLFSKGIFGGMSGVVYALLGYLWFIELLNQFLNKNNSQMVTSNRIQKNIAYFLIGFMFLGVFGILGDSIGNASHLSGFTVGLIIAAIQVFRQKNKSKLRIL